jgi:hypothetical protein
MTRPNDWLRLWIVLSVLYLPALLVVAFTISIWPTPERTLHRDEFLTRMPADLRGQVEAAYSSTSEWEAALKKRPGVPPNFIPDSQPVKLANGVILQIRVAKKGDTEPDFRVAEAYWAIVKSETRARWWQMVLVMVLPVVHPLLGALRPRLGGGVGPARILPSVRRPSPLRQAGRRCG